MNRFRKNHYQWTLIAAAAPVAGRAQASGNRNSMVYAHGADSALRLAAAEHITATRKPTWLAI